MKLTREQSKKLLQERGIWITEACDKCGKLLGSVRWTRRGEPGEWCSAECRDGISLTRKMPIASAAVLAPSPVHRLRVGARPAGRPKKHANNAEKCREYRNRLQSVLVTRNTPSELIENSQLADAKIRSHVVPPSQPAEGPKNAFYAGLGKPWQRRDMRTVTLSHMEED